MKKLVILTCTFIFIGVTRVYAQAPAHEPDTLSHPVQQGDPALETLPPRLDYVEDLKRITAEQLPEAVQQSLQGDSQFAGWKDATFFHDQNTDEYVIELRKNGRKIVHRFNKEGEKIIEQQ